MGKLGSLVEKLQGIGGKQIPREQTPQSLEKITEGSKPMGDGHSGGTEVSIEPSDETRATHGDRTYTTTGRRPRLMETLNNFKKEHPKLYSTMCDAGVGVGKVAVIGTVSAGLGLGVEGVLNYVPLIGEYAAGIAGPATTGIVGWYMSDRAFTEKNLMNRFFDFITKATTLDIAIAGILASTSTLINTGIDHLAIESLDPITLKNYVERVNYMVYSAIPTSLIAGLSAFADISIPKITKKTLKFVNKSKREIALGLSVIATYFGSDYLLNYLGAEPETSGLISKAAATSVAYVGSNYLKSPLKYGIKLLSVLYGGVLFSKTGIPEDATNFIAKYASFAKDHPKFTSIVATYLPVAGALVVVEFLTKKIYQPKTNKT